MNPWSMGAMQSNMMSMRLSRRPAILEPAGAQAQLLWECNSCAMDSPVTPELVV